MSGAVKTGSPRADNMALVEGRAPAGGAPDVAAEPTHFPLFDGLRAIAALIVLTGHASQATHAEENAWFGIYTSRPGLGVVLFFVISGFLLYRPFFRARYEDRRPTRLGEYARRRVLRIVPAYWLALTVLALWMSLPGVFGSHWYAFYGFGQVYSRQTSEEGLGVAWTLCVELTFYLLLPLYSAAMSRLVERYPRRGSVRLEVLVLIGLALGANAFRLALPEDQPYLASTLPSCLDWFAIGMGLAVASVVLGERTGAAPRIVRLVLRWPSACWLGAVALFVVLAVSIDVTAQSLLDHNLNRFAVTYEHLMYGAVAFLVVLPAIFGGHTTHGAPRKLLNLRVMTWLGLVSYGIYLWHHPLLFWLLERGLLDLWPDNPLPLAVAATLAMTSLFAAASWYLLERPLMRFRSVGRVRRS